MLDLADDELRAYISGQETPDDLLATVVILAKELLYRREEAKKNDFYIDELEKRLEPCSCQSGKCLQHDD